MCLSSFPDDQWWNLSHGILLSCGFLPARRLYPWHVLRDPRAATPNRCRLIILLLYFVLHTVKNISSEKCFLYTHWHQQICQIIIYLKTLKDWKTLRWWDLFDFCQETVVLAGTVTTQVQLSINTCVQPDPTVRPDRTSPLRVQLELTLVWITMELSVTVSTVQPAITAMVIHNICFHWTL